MTQYRISSFQPARQSMFDHLCKTKTLSGPGDIWPDQPDVSWCFGCGYAWLFHTEPACLRACVPACLRACVPACLRACVPACLRACMCPCPRMRTRGRAARCVGGLGVCVWACARAEGEGEDAGEGETKDTKCVAKSARCTRPFLIRRTARSVLESCTARSKSEKWGPGALHLAARDPPTMSYAVSILHR